MRTTKQSIISSRMNLTDEITIRAPFIKIFGAAANLPRWPVSPTLPLQPIYHANTLGWDCSDVLRELSDQYQVGFRVPNRHREPTAPLSPSSINPERHTRDESHLGFPGTAGRLRPRHHQPSARTEADNDRTGTRQLGGWTIFYSRYRWKDSRRIETESRSPGIFGRDSSLSKDAIHTPADRRRIDQTSATRESDRTCHAFEVSRV